MKKVLFLPLYLVFLLPIKVLTSSPSQVSAACSKFAAGEIDAYKTLEALGLDIGNYSIGVINTAKIYCA